MKYKSPYKTAILLQQKLLMEKEREIAVFRLEKVKLEKRLEEYQKRETDFYELLMNEMEFDVNMLKHRVDKKGKNTIKLLIEQATKKIHELNVEYMVIKHKIESIKDLDKEKEKEFNKEKMKRESKKIESVMLVKKWKEEMENGGNNQNI